MIPVGFMFIQCTKGSEDKILDVVRSIPEVTYAYKVDSVPMFVVAGRWMTSPSTAGSQERSLAVVDQLVQKARSAK